MAKRQTTNSEIRRRYLERVSEIPVCNEAWVAAGMSISERARRAWQVRHEARLQARALMDPVEVELVRARDQAVYGNPDGPTFDDLMNRGRESGLTGAAIFEAIIEASYRTDAELNQKFGL